MMVMRVIFRIIQSANRILNSSCLCEKTRIQRKLFMHSPVTSLEFYDRLMIGIYSLFDSYLQSHIVDFDVFQVVTE